MGCPTCHKSTHFMRATHSTRTLRSSERIAAKITGAGQEARPVAKTSVVKFAKRTAQQAPAQLEQCPLVSLGDFVAAAIIVVEALARRTRSRVGRDAEYAARIILRTSNSGSLAMFTANRRASSLVSSFAADCRPWAHPPKHFTWCSSYQALKVWT
jgi:hypothetical protein